MNKMLIISILIQSQWSKCWSQRRKGHQWFKIAFYPKIRFEIIWRIFIKKLWEVRIILIERPIWFLGIVSAPRNLVIMSLNKWRFFAEMKKHPEWKCLSGWDKTEKTTGTSLKSKCIFNDPLSFWIYFQLASIELKGYYIQNEFVCAF